MSSLREVIDRASAQASEGTVVIYATALEDSSDGEVLVRFDDDLLPDSFMEDGVEVDFEEDEGSLDEINEDAEADELGVDDVATDISEDEVLIESE